ncbi:DUF1764-domain-containing protein [Hyaloraphidium curvatum]|nr:DUF1764-domain-containing protein [Hyaloraphidium curvatum]
MPKPSAPKPSEAATAPAKRKAASEIDDIFAARGKSGPAKEAKDAKKPAEEEPILANEAPKKKKKKSKPASDGASDAKDAKVEVVDLSAKPSSAKKKKLVDEDGFADSRGSSGRKKIDGLDVYSRAELGLVEDRPGGDTPLCPFDCPPECCS